MIKQPRITAGDIWREQGNAMLMRLIAGEKGLYRYIDHPRIQKPSLAFAGYLEHLSDYRLQVIGQTELSFLATCSEDHQQRVVKDVFDLRLAAVVVTRGITPPQVIIDAANATDTPLFVSEHTSAYLMTEMTLYLSHRLAPVAFQHGVFLDVYGLGVLMTGPSGIGKSEIGLELISRGHRLVADDMVELTRRSPTVLVGQGPESLLFHMEIRGLGVLNIRDLYGSSAITLTKRVGLVVEFLPWDQRVEASRVLGVRAETIINDVALPKVKIPIGSGRSMAIMVELAVRDQMAVNLGIDSTEEFAKALEKRILNNSTNEAVD
ncbi:MAG: HPr(Ser) kinase/phosphatase [Zetaproteobacteria bacterium]|nr:HPr(Ser) kinase/phosphatase [Zetaproteobacteria bacterium]